MKRTSVKVLVGLGVLMLGAVGLAAPSTPITLTVTTNGDGTGTCDFSTNECPTLRGAISQASDGDIITFADGLAGQTITLTSALPEITVANLTIDASALTDKVTIERDATAANFRIFTHRNMSGGSFAINNLVVTGGSGSTGFGGGIYSFSNITVTNSTISGNKASTGNGGGIYSVGNITVTDSTISGNTAGDGGGIRSFGNATVTNSTISGNTATNGDGGGIESSGNVTVTNSTISGNKASTGNGGGIYSFSNITVTDSTISGNTAGDGGGVRTFMGGSIILSGCNTFENNTAGTGDQWNVVGTATDDNGDLDTVREDPYVGCPTSGGGTVINPDPDMQIRNGDSTAAASITATTTVNIGAFKRGEVATIDFLIRNPGAQVLEIGELVLPSFLSNVGEPLPETLASFESSLLTLEVNTSAAGALEGEFSLASNDPDAFENPFVFTITGSVSETPANVLNILPGVDLGDVSAATGQEDVVLLSFKLQVPAGSVPVSVDSLTLAASNVGIGRASNLRLYIDGGTRGELDSLDVFVSATDDTEALTFSFPTRTFSPELPMWFIVVGDF